jgi:hypothetical protein
MVLECDVSEQTESGHKTKGDVDLFRVQNYTITVFISFETSPKVQEDVREKETINRKVHLQANTNSMCSCFDVNWTNQLTSTVCRVNLSPNASPNGAVTKTMTSNESKKESQATRVGLEGKSMQEPPETSFSDSSSSSLFER